MLRLCKTLVKKRKEKRNKETLLRGKESCLTTNSLEPQHSFTQKDLKVDVTLMKSHSNHCNNSKFLLTQFLEGVQGSMKLQIMKMQNTNLQIKLSYNITPQLGVCVYRCPIINALPLASVDVEISTSEL